MPGGGKSTVGRLVARRLGVSFADADKAIEGRAQSTIAAIFERIGEEGFRQLESEVLAELVGTAGVVATGGGAVLRADNRELLRTKTHCVYLRVPYDTLMKRLRWDRKRPLMQVADPEQRVHDLMAERHPLYLETAFATVETAGLSLDQVVTAVVDSLPAERGPEAGPR